MKKSFVKRAVLPSIETNPSGVVKYMSDCPASLIVYFLKRHKDMFKKSQYLPLLGMARYTLDNPREVRPRRGNLDAERIIEVDGIPFEYLPIKDELGALKGIVRILGMTLLFRAARVWDHLKEEYTNQFRLIYEVIDTADPKSNPPEQQDNEMLSQWEP